MRDPIFHDRLVAKLQYFADVLKHTKIEKETCLISLDIKSLEKENLKNQIFLYQEILNEYYETFDDILYR